MLTFLANIKIGYQMITNITDINKVYQTECLHEKWHAHIWNKHGAGHITLCDIFDTDYQNV